MSHLCHDALILSFRYYVSTSFGGQGENSSPGRLPLKFASLLYNLSIYLCNIDLLCTSGLNCCYGYHVHSWAVSISFVMYLFVAFVYKANSCLFCLLFKGFLTTMSINSLPVVHVTEYSKHRDSSFFQFQLVDLLATCIWESPFFTHLPAFCYCNKYPRQTYLKRGKLPFGSQLDKFLSPCWLSLFLCRYANPAYHSGGSRDGSFHSSVGKKTKIPKSSGSIWG